MRITNKIMQQNNLSNINTNKIYQDKLSNEMSTQKKINKPSDDPVVAIRALRLRSNVTEITQYYSKNIPDATSWLSVTEDALKNLSAIVTNMIGQCTKGANGALTTSDRQIILEQMNALGDEIYTTGDADYAGRYVFTGYRTDTSLCFDKEQTLPYSITEQISNSTIDSVVSVNLKSGNQSVLDINSSNYMGININEEAIQSVEVHRIRLAYKDLVAAETGKPQISFKDSSGNTRTWGDSDIRIMHDFENPYSEIANDPDGIIYVPETGEILLGDSKYQELAALKDDDSTVADESIISISYRKDNWQKGDLRPEHYFYCEANPDTAERIVYNESYLTEDSEHQKIEYDVGFNQSIQVNSTADQCFKHGIGREVDDLTNAMKDVQKLETVQSCIKNVMEKVAPDSAEYEKLKTQLDAVEKALTLARDKEQKLFEKGIKTFQSYLDETNLTITECGTRSKKLELIQNRMQNQKTTFETLKSENEDVDITEVAIQLSSAEMTYEAALMATGKVMKTTLLDFI